MIRTLLIPLISVLLGVHTQAEFDALPERLDSALRAVETPELIDIHIGPGVYFYGERHLDLEWVDLPGTRIVMTGEDCTLIARDDGRGYALGNNYIDLATLEPEDTWTSVRKAKGWPVPVLFKKGVYKIRCQEPDLSEEDARNMWLHISQWFKGPFFPVVRIRNGWLYFRKEGDPGTSLWSELRFGRCLPRYILCDKPVRKDLHACTVTNFLSARNSRLKELRMEGITFFGNADGDYLIWLDGFRADSVTIRSCTFTHLRSAGIKLDGVDGFRLEDCLFKGNYQGCIRIAQDCRNTAVTRNRFIGNGRMLTNFPLISCSGVDYLVSDNYIEDFSYSAIGLGVHFTEEDRYGTCGVVERNEICQSEAFRQAPMRSLVDAGAIYITTNNKRAVIRDNYIHDIDGPHSNRGIFADDGVTNVTIEGNTVLRIMNGRCIDLRRCFRVARLPGTTVARANVGNRIEGNVCDGKVRYFIRKNDPESWVRNNRQVCR